MYPGAYRDATYPTRDKVIPLGRFVAMSSATNALEAAETFRIAHAVSLGKAAIDADEKGRRQVQRAFRDLQREAFPLVHTNNGEE